MISSHDYAAKLQRIAQFLLLQPEFKLIDLPDQLYYWDRDEFAEAVRAVGPGQKKFSDSYLDFVPHGCKELTVRAQRATVCKLVHPAEYECEPILAMADGGTEVVESTTESTDDIPF